MYFFFNDTATTEIYTLSLHDALPICEQLACGEHLVLRVGDRVDDRVVAQQADQRRGAVVAEPAGVDRKSTRLNSSHANISYAVFCLKKKKLDTSCTPWGDS